MKMKRSFAALLCAVSLIGLSACGAKAPSNAVEMFDAYQAAVTDTGFNVSGDIAATVALDYLDSGASMNMEIPITMSMDVDVFNDTMHGTMTVSSSIFGTDFSQDVEFYSETEDSSTKTYMCTADGVWTTTDAGNYSGFGELNESADALFDKGDGVYTVTARLSELMGEEQLEEFLGEMSGELADVDIEYIEDMLRNSAVVYTFDAETSYLLSIHMDELNYGTFVSTDDVVVDEKTIEDNSEGTADPDIPMSVSISLEFDLAFDNYGEVSADDVAIPDEVKNSAVMADDDGGFGLSDNNAISF